LREVTNRLGQQLRDVAGQYLWAHAQPDSQLYQCAGSKHLADLIDGHGHCGADPVLLEVIDDSPQAAVLLDQGAHDRYQIGVDSHVTCFVCNKRARIIPALIGRDCKQVSNPEGAERYGIAQGLHRRNAVLPIVPDGA